MKPESKETPADELSESSAQQAKEKKAGTEQHPKTAASGVTVPEEFQQKVHELVSKATKHHLHHISDRVSARHDELRQEEMAKNKKGGKNTPNEYSTEGMPSL